MAEPTVEVEPLESMEARAKELARAARRRALVASPPRSPPREELGPNWDELTTQSSEGTDGVDSTQRLEGARRKASEFESRPGHQVGNLRGEFGRAGFPFLLPA